MKKFSIFLLLGAVLASAIAQGQTASAAALSKIKPVPVVQPVSKEVASASATASTTTETSKKSDAKDAAATDPANAANGTTPAPAAKPATAAAKETKATQASTGVVPITVKGGREWSAFTTGSENDLSDRAEEIAPRLKPLQGPAAAQTREIGMQVSNWDLSEVLGSLTAQTGINIVLISDQNPKVTVSLQRMPLDEVVRVVSSIAKMSVIGLRGGYVVGPRDVLKQAFPNEWSAQSDEGSGEDTNFLEMYTVRHVDPTQLADALRGVYEDNLTVKVGPGKLRPVDLDMGSGGGGSSSDSAQGGSNGGSATTGTSTSNGSGRQLVLTGNRATVMQALALARRLDTKQRQVSIQVEILDVSNDALRDLGVNWQGSTDVAIEESGPRGINFGSFARDPLSLGATLRHLETSGRAKVLARPNISLLDQERGYILIGNRINYPVVVSINDAGQPVFDVKEERVGIYLQVAAAINEENDVTLNLYPQVSTISGFLTVNQSSYPQISTREARTSMRVSSGRTLVMGGLISDEEIRTVEKVPILGQIPLFGELFTRRKTTNRQSQVVILITPTVDATN